MCMRKLVNSGGIKVSAKVVIFDNDYRCYVEGNYIAGKDGVLIADLHHSLSDLSLNLSEMSDIQIWALCEPIIQAYERGVKKTQDKMTKKLLKMFDLKEEELQCTNAKLVTARI